MLLGIVLALLLAPFLSAQNMGGPVGMGVPSMNGPTLANSVGALPDMTARRPLYVSGRVLVEGGAGPPASITIEMVCNGSAQPQGHTDAKGHFGFQLGREQGGMDDASYSIGGDSAGLHSSTDGMTHAPGAGGIGIAEKDLGGCEIRANLPGFDSERIKLAGRRAMDHPDVGTIVLRRLAGVSGYTYSMTSAKAPKDARKALEKGQDLIKKKKPDEAAEQFRKATTVYPKYAEAWYELGCLQMAAKQLADARTSLRTALDADPKYVSPYLRLANVALMESKWSEVVQITDQVTKMDPISYSVSYYMNSVANLQLRQLELAEKSARELLKLDQAHHYPRGVYVLALTLAQQQKVPEAIEQLRAYLLLVPDAPDTETVKKQVAQLEQIANARP